MTRHLLVVLLIGLSWPASVSAQPAKVSRVGFLFAGAESVQRNRAQIVEQGLRELGWVKGQNIAFVARWAEGRFDRLSTLAADLVRLKPDVIVTSGAQAVQALKAATSTIPIVVGVMSDPVGAGFAASFARPEICPSSSRRGSS